ncbi:MAG: 4'-phosphopantetheinyl transferase family protein [Candidatus Hodarchaeales archaeon]
MLDLQKFSISDQEVHIWTVTLSNQVVSTDEIKSILSYSELRKIDEFNVVSDKERYTYYRGLLRLILSKYLTIQPEKIIINISEKGRPFIKDSDINFNISHKGDFAVVAVTKNCEIGIDVENLDDNVNYFRLIERFFTVDEKKNFNILRPSSQRILFFRIWTMKEASGKALGEDIVSSFNKFSIEFSENEILGLEFKGDPIKYHWWFHNRIIFDKYACSVVTTDIRNKVKYFNL